MAWTPSHSRSSSGSSFSSNASVDQPFVRTTRPSPAYISAGSPPASPLPYSNTADHFHQHHQAEDRFSHYGHKELLKMSAAALSDRRNSTFLGGFFGGDVNAATATSRPTSSLSTGKESVFSTASRRTSVAGPPASSARRFTTFFGLGANSNKSTTSSLAFGNGSTTSGSRSCSQCTSHYSMPSSFNSTLVKADEYEGVDFAKILSTPSSPLSCTPAALRELQEEALKIIDKLYNSYIERTRALNETMNEVEALREEASEKDIRIESLRHQVEGLANVQESLSKAAEDARTAAEVAREEARAAQAERNRLVWASKTIRPINPEDDEEESEEEHTDLHSLASAQRFSRHSVVASSRFNFQPQQAKYSPSDSGFESGSDSGSLFASEYSPFGPKRGSTQTQSLFGNNNVFLPPSLDKFTPPASPTREKDREASLSSAMVPPQVTMQQQQGGMFKKNKNRVKSVCACSGDKPGWDVVRVLREENGSLKGRLSELEDCLGACMDIVGGNF